MKFDPWTSAEAKTRFGLDINIFQLPVLEFTIDSEENEYDDGPDHTEI